MNLLLIEDEIGLSDALDAVLTKEGYIVEVANDGADGCHLALTGIYDVIILDLMLPNKDGLTILKEIRQNKLATPILLLTARSELEDKVTGLDLGADDYLTKPFMKEELLARLRVITRRTGNIIEDILTFDDLTLSLKKCEIYKTDTINTIKLGAKEFHLLETLIRNQNQILTKEQLAEKIWGYDHNAEYNTVEVYISFLRKKIQFIGSNVKIKSTRGVGYSLES